MGHSRLGGGLWHVTKQARDEAILRLMNLNETLGELQTTVAEINAPDLARFVDEFGYQVREDILGLVKYNLGRQQQKNLMVLLNKCGEWIDEERKELQSHRYFPGLRVVTPEGERRLCDLERFEAFFHVMAKDILRLMADHDYRKQNEKTKRERTKATASENTSAQD